MKYCFYASPKMEALFIQIKKDIERLNPFTVLIKCTWHLRQVYPLIYKEIIQNIKNKELK